MGKEVTTEDICRARDIRMEKLKVHFEGSAEGLILFLLNIPGSIKDSPLYRKVFNTGIRLLKHNFNKRNITFAVSEINIPESGTGPEAYISVSEYDLMSVKKITAEIENSHPLGRIFDIDIFDRKLEQVKSGREMRKCFICDRPAFECARSRRHPLSEVIEHIKKEAEKYFDSLCWKTASTAARAMMTEVLVTPKPGLVDRANPGAHSDMDIFTFTDSTTALVKTFYDMASKAFSFSSSEKRYPDNNSLTQINTEELPYSISDRTDLSEDKLSSPENRKKSSLKISENDLTYLLPPLRETGLEGEKAMFEITGGVNTQKGLIFSIGILAGAAGYLFSSSMEEITPELICLTGKKIVKGITEKDFEKTGSSSGKEENILITKAEVSINSEMRASEKQGISVSAEPEKDITTGEKIYRKHGIKGARGEAEGGFKSSLKALALLYSRLEEGRDFNLSLADVLIHIISETEDTNIPGRNSIETLSYAEKMCRNFIMSGGVFRENGIEELKKLDRDFIEKNISPGGSADILATTLFLYFMDKESSFNN